MATGLRPCLQRTARHARPLHCPGAHAKLAPSIAGTCGVPRASA